MHDGDLETALARAEQALARIESAARQESAARRRNDQLRNRVREAIAELDDLIHKAEA